MTSKTSKKIPAKPQIKPLTKAMVRAGLRKEFVDPDNPISFNNATTLGKLTNWIFSQISSETKAKVAANKRNVHKAKLKEIERKQKASNLAKRLKDAGIKPKPNKKGGPVRKPRKV